MKLSFKRNYFKFAKYGIFLFPLAIILVYFFIQVMYGFHNDFFDLLYQKYPTVHSTNIDLKFYTEFSDEDGPLENASAIIFFMASIIGYIVVGKFFKTRKILYGFLYLFLAFSFMMLALEEISWGQRIFDLETPESFSSNLQNQITLHNLESILPYLHDFLMLVGFFGAFSWIFFWKLRKTKYRKFIRFFVPSWYLVFYFIPIFLFYLIGYFMPYDPQVYELGDFLPMNDQEPPKLLLALGLMFFTMITFVRQKVS